ncbi:unnamed protein product [Amoebophrya sp. A25]|nr:unnamed protein product [Amoebophrya sp. A25]|eukprot:GSA25T00010094001.1
MGNVQSSSDADGVPAGWCLIQPVEMHSPKEAAAGRRSGGSSSSTSQQQQGQLAQGLSGSSSIQQMFPSATAPGMLFDSTMFDSSMFDSSMWTDRSSWLGGGAKPSGGSADDAENDDDDWLAVEDFDEVYGRAAGRAAGGGSASSTAPPHVVIGDYIKKAGEYLKTTIASGAGAVGSEDPGVGDAEVATNKDLAASTISLVGKPLTRLLVIYVQKYPRALILRLRRNPTTGEAEFRAEWRHIVKKEAVESFSESLLSTQGLSLLLGKLIEVLKIDKSYTLQDEALAEEEWRKEQLETLEKKRVEAQKVVGKAQEKDRLKHQKRLEKVEKDRQELDKRSPPAPNGKVLKLLGTEGLDCARMRYDGTDVGAGFFLCHPRVPVTHIWCVVEWTCWGTIPNLREIHFYSGSTLGHVYKHDVPGGTEREDGGRK